MQPYSQLDEGLNEVVSTWRNGVANLPPTSGADEVGETSHPPCAPEPTLLSLQRHAIGAHIAFGRYLAAFNRALGYSISFTCEGDPREVFSARIYVYYCGATNETLGVLMKFRKDFQPGFRCFLARRLLVGMGVRFPKGDFPRPFLVAESDDNPAALAGYEALRKDDRSRRCRGVIVQWWLEERGGTCLGGGKANGSVGGWNGAHDGK